MHELSIAEAVLEQVQRLMPAGAHLRCVRLRAGPLRGIDAMAMSWAWRSVTAATPLADSRIEVTVLPWTLRCPQCGREWTSEEWDNPCECGEPASRPVGGDELILASLQVDPAPAHAPE